MILHIRNMVCNRCKLVVKNVLEDLGIDYDYVAMGEVKLLNTLAESEREGLEAALHSYGFEIIGDQKSLLIHKIKTLIVNLVQEQDGELKTNLSDYLSSRLHHDYSYLSNLFTAVAGTTIEKYYISQKIEKVKELLVYNELSLSEIAFRLHYSSVAHLSNQFKKVTGLTPSHFKKIGQEKRKSLDEV